MVEAVRSLPTQNYLRGTASFMEDPDFQDVVERAQSLVEKISQDIPATHKSSIVIKGLPFESSSSDLGKLQYMKELLNIPSAPTLKTLSSSFTLEMCLSHISEGLQLHQALLRALISKLEQPERVAMLQADLRDLLIQISEMQRLVGAESSVQVGMVDLTQRLTDEYKTQVAAHLVLLQLHGFGQDVSRVLRNMSPTEPQ